MTFEAPPASTSRGASGRLLVVGIFGLAILASGFAWWWNFNRGHLALDLYGSEGAMLIRTAPKVEVLRQKPEGNLDISRAPGLINARASLLSDASYEWPATNLRQDSPLFSVRFSQGKRSIDVVFDFENETISNSVTQRLAKLKTKTAEGWRSYLARQVKAANK